MPVIRIPEVLRQKLTESGANALVEVLNQVEQSSKENVIELAAERFERRLSEEISKLDMRMTGEISRLDQRITQEVAGLRVLISQVETRILRWLVVLWASQMATTYGLFLRLK